MYINIFTLVKCLKDFMKYTKFHVIQVHLVETTTYIPERDNCVIWRPSIHEWFTSNGILNKPRFCFMLESILTV